MITSPLCYLAKKGNNCCREEKRRKKEVNRKTKPLANGEEGPGPTYNKQEHYNPSAKKVPNEASSQKADRTKPESSNQDQQGTQIKKYPFMKECTTARHWAPQPTLKQEKENGRQNRKKTGVSRQAKRLFGNLNGIAIPFPCKGSKKRRKK